MEIHHEELGDVSRYIANHAEIRIQDKEEHFRQLLRAVNLLAEVGPESRILEVGTGTGWFPILCELNGYTCDGLEISPQLVELAKETGRAHGVEAKVRLGNVEDKPLEASTYDVIIASSVFEHVELWKDGLSHLYDALKPDGVLYWESTNKYSLVSGEHWWPLYGWLPDGARYRLRRILQGDDIMKLGIDFHQFTYPLVRRECERIGFKRVLDRVDIARPERVESGVKRAVLSACKRSPAIRKLVLRHFPLTTFVCQK